MEALHENLPRLAKRLCGEDSNILLSRSCDQDLITYSLTIFKSSQPRSLQTMVTSCKNRVQPAQSFQKVEERNW